jgi:UDP-glucose 4-epimerase
MRPDEIITFKRVFISGGAGFIGSHFAARLLALPVIEKITVYDNFSTGKRDHLVQLLSERRLAVVEGEIADSDLLVRSMTGHDCVIHLASNADIACSASEPARDFLQGTQLTHYVLEAARLVGASFFVYASGSGVYGEVGDKEMREDSGPLLPISTYGASKLAGEALICSYSHMFSMRALAFRFANVVGSRQTHGVVFDFIRKLQENANRLEILGDGNQSKSYIHVDDALDGIFTACGKHKDGYDVFNLGSEDHITVREIADLVIRRVVGNPECVELIFAGGDRGWKGDVPVVRLNTDKAKALGWRCRLSSRQALEASLDHLVAR